MLVRFEIDGNWVEQEWSTPPIGLWDNSLTTWAIEQVAVLVRALQRQAAEREEMKKAITPPAQETR